ncbi:protein ANTI-SILENCING 1-like isoform X3 [Rhododendron vialii]|uniref:protein ANTI-SILENCING 1-like isoform X3 n=1 Tax=Rhododendron vialii TaxID=182163 RepID=UPI00265D7A4E|nr:protein ANTI-SILENCING 1-like isoform X3 [Rhododendron vialii]
MSLLGEAHEDHTEFNWGRQTGVGGPNKDFLLYGSFTHGGVEYFLYDCVYMWRDNELDIGKIVKIWETPSHSKKVKVVWFFRPIEIRQWLGDVEPLWNEIFLASGEGNGLCNRNPLEAICGKCNVVCTSKDKRNPQPSKEDLRMADYIFNRTFDVARCTISPIFPDVIAESEVKHFFNREKDPKLIASEDGANLKGKIANPSSFVKVEGVTALRNPVKDGKFDMSPKPAAKVADKAEMKCVHNLSPTSLSDKSHKRRRVHFSIVDPKEEHSNRVKGSKSDNQPQEITRRPVVGGLGLLPKEELFNGVKGSKSDNQPQEITRRPAVGGLGLLPKEELSYGVKGSKSDNQPQEITRRPAVQTSKWFDQQSWMEKLKSAYERGTLVLLENLDPSYTSSEVEDIVWSALKEMGEAKMVPRCTLSSPDHGQAFFIFKSVDAAERAISELKEKCLMLSNGRPLLGRKGCLVEPNNASTSFVGHMVINNLKLQKQKAEWKIAVSTSHYSQPNTIEYDMALEWLVLQERSKLRWDALNKQQAEEIEQLRSQLKTHHNA